jgi:hypothetical protein
MRQQGAEGSGSFATGLRIVPAKNLPPLTFEIEPGSVVYLGDLHGMTQAGRNLLGMKVTGDGYPQVRDCHQRDIEILYNKYPQFRGKVRQQLLPLGPWVPEEMKQGLPASPACGA